MEVIINGHIVSYESDFDPVHEDQNVKRNWKVSAGDFFKYPVKIDGVDLVECFIKRFDKKSTDISGYDFLVKIKGKKLKGLPVVFDLVQTTEHGNAVIYLFMEYIHGKTLDSLQREGFTFKPCKLAEDLFYAIKSIHDSGFWFPDFDPKNFLRSEKGDFYIIDLDSTYPLATMPVPKMYGCKDYWAPAYDFYVENAGFTRAEVKKIRGDLLNLLNLIYLMGLYSFYLDEQGEDLTARSIGRLNKYLKEKHKLFSSTMVYCFNKNGNPDTFNQRIPSLEVFKNFLETVLFSEDFERTIADAPKIPEIIFFRANGNETNDLEVNAGNKIVFEWETRDATSIRLLPGKVVLNNKGTLAISPSEDVTYCLQAVHKYKSKAQELKRSIDVNIFDPELKKPVIEFNISGLAHAPVLLENSRYTIHWKVSNAQQVFLDDKKVMPEGMRTLVAASPATHTLKAINEKHDRTKRSVATLQIETEKRPEIQINVSPLKVKSGYPVKIAWKSAYGRDIAILKDGIPIAINQQNKGYMDVIVKRNKKSPNPNEVHFTASAFSESGLSSLATSIDEVVIIEKSFNPVWIILAIVVAILVIFLIFQLQNSQL